MGVLVDWRDVRLSLSLSVCVWSFTECIANELINIHPRTLGRVPGGGQNKVAEVAHFSGGIERDGDRRSERERETK